jgi:hypothetical protein
MDMNFLQLKNLADKNEIRIDDHNGSKSSPDHYYESLRNAFGFYFNTFQKINSSYDFYINSTSTAKKEYLDILERQHLDIENSVLTIVSFERFFELFLKNLLKKTNRKLIYQEAHKSKSNISYKKSRNTWKLIDKIQSNEFIPHKPPAGRIPYTIAFRETIERFFELINYTKDASKTNNAIVKKFKKVVAPFAFFDNSNCQSTLEFINWYRDRILHNGNKLPRLRFLDYIITQRIIPLSIDILNAEPNMPSDWLFFTKSISGIEILTEMNKLKFTPINTKNNKQIINTFNTLLYLGHLKEIGRANMNMNLAVRSNRSAYEYNYYEVKGRGIRFAQAEKDNHPNAKDIRKCPCCNENSLVLYIIYGQDQPIINNEDIEWITCYTCNYHLRYNVFDLHYFDNKHEKHFSYQLP